MENPHLVIIFAKLSPWGIFLNAFGCLLSPLLSLNEFQETSEASLLLTPTLTTSPLSGSYQEQRFSLHK
jgi:hypothetical protein